MKRVLLPLLLAPCMASAGLVIINDGSAKAKQMLAQAELQKGGRLAAVVSAAGGAPAVSGVPVVEIEQWEIKAGASLRTTLENWCDRAGYRLVWNVDGGFRSQGSFTAEGDFKKAVKELFAAVPQDLHLDVDITKNKLVIVSRVAK